MPILSKQIELKFRAGDRILILSEMDEDGFYVGQLESSGRRGLVPSNFLRELPRVATEENAVLFNSGASDGGGVYDSKPKTVFGMPGSGPTHGSKSSHARGASGNRSTLRSDDVDLGPDSGPRRSSGRTGGKISEQVSRGRVRADKIEDAEGDEEDSMITSTVPPPNPSDWPDGSEVSVNLHSVVPLSTTSAAANAVVTPTLGLPTLTDHGSNCNLVGSGGGDEELSKDSPDSNGQGGVIIMDFNSKKHSKNRKSSLSRNSSNEQSQDHGPGDSQSRRRSVFKSPFKKIPHATE
ncbi:RIMS-binding protein 3A [Taenia solium]|eukprot:TsM_000350900 transcript=TsM_000350900 gene=TsM_000350900